MQAVADVLAERLRAAFDEVAPGADPVLRPSDRADYQANGALALAKRLGRNPREVAEDVAAAARGELEGICDQVEVSGPGFVNLVLAASFVEGKVAEMAADAGLGLEPVAEPETVVVTYSHPNVAKEMHVGHLRSTVIGDAICRMLSRLGHNVVRENHVGDWGTPFGMLIEHLIDLGEEKAVHELSVGDLTSFYQAARTSFDVDDVFKERSRHRVVLLQSGDPETLRLWRVLVEESIAYFDEVYAKLGVLLTDDDIKGESFYNPLLPSVVADLDAAGLLVEDDGARCVFPPGFSNRSGDPLPLIVQKSDGGFGYAATDLACIRDRVDRVGARRLLYVVGAPQAQHLQMCFAVARMAGWLPPQVEAEHVAFGNVLGEDHRMLRTRAGQSVKLVDLLDEAVVRARAAMVVHRTGGRGAAGAGPVPETADPGADAAGQPAGHEPAAEAAEAARGEATVAAESAETARALGIGAVKYADLSTERIKDYVFEWDRMLAFEGDTGPYLQYAHARIRSVFRRAAAAGARVPAPGGRLHVVEAQERALGLALLGYPTALADAVAGSAPSKLCAYLYRLATTFTAFYERCPILRAPDASTRASRLLLADITARVLADGLALLGMEAPERM